MRVQIATRHCHVPDPVQDRTRELVERLRRFDDRLSAAEVVFEEEKHLRKVEGILSVDREEPVVAQGEGEEFRSALDQMVSRLERILKRRRGRRRSHHGPRISEGAGATVVPE